MMMKNNKSVTETKSEETKVVEDTKVTVVDGESGTETNISSTTVTHEVVKENYDASSNTTTTTTTTEEDQAVDVSSKALVVADAETENNTNNQSDTNNENGGLLRRFISDHVVRVLRDDDDDTEKSDEESNDDLSPTKIPIADLTAEELEALKGRELASSLAPFGK